MPLRPLAIVPLKDFHEAKERLDLSPDNRSSLTQAVAEHVIKACRGGGMAPVVVTGSDSTRVWAAAFGVDVLVETGEGLDAAAAHGADQAGGGPWLVVHGDLPLLSAEDIAHVGHLLARGGVVLAPSRDGGTNLLGSTGGGFDFRYGPASFHRHLAVAAGREVEVVIRPGTALEIDTLSDLHSVARLPSGEWLRRFLS